MLLFSFFIRSKCVGHPISELRQGAHLFCLDNLNKNPLQSGLTLPCGQGIGSAFWSQHNSFSFKRIGNYAFMFHGCFLAAQEKHDGIKAFFPANFIKS